jgi:hypothetical protein
MLENGLVLAQKGIRIKSLISPSLIEVSYDQSLGYDQSLYCVPKEETRSQHSALVEVRSVRLMLFIAASQTTPSR